MIGWESWFLSISIATFQYISIIGRAKKKKLAKDQKLDMSLSSIDPSTQNIPFFQPRFSHEHVHFWGIFYCHDSQIIHVWYIYLHLLHKWPSFVGKYTSTMDDLGLIAGEPVSQTSQTTTHWAQNREGMPDLPGHPGTHPIRTRWCSSSLATLVY